MPTPPDSPRSPAQAWSRLPNPREARIGNPLQHAAVPKRKRDHGAWQYDEDWNGDLGETGMYTHVSKRSCGVLGDPRATHLDTYPLGLAPADQAHQALAIWPSPPSSPDVNGYTSSIPSYAALRSEFQSGLQAVAEDIASQTTRTPSSDEQDMPEEAWASRQTDFSLHSTDTHCPPAWPASPDELSSAYPVPLDPHAAIESRCGSSDTLSFILDCLPTRDGRQAFVETISESGSEDLYHAGSNISELAIDFKDFRVD